MKESILLKVDSDVYKNFKIALSLSGETSDEAADACLRWYIAQAFENASKKYSPQNIKQTNSVKDSNYGKALHRIPKWASSPNQYNHKIVKAYFMSVDIAGEATLNMMERLCSDKERPDLYVPTFRNNYSQMKTDAGNPHGKVFEDDGERVWIWEEVKETLLKYKESFYSTKK